MYKLWSAIMILLERASMFFLIERFWVEHRDRAASQLNHGPDKRSWFSRPRPFPAAPAFSRRRRRCLHEGTYPPEIPEATAAASYMHTEWNGAISSKFSWRGNKWPVPGSIRESDRTKADKNARVFSPVGQKATPRRRYGTVSNFREALRSWILACESRRPLTATGRGSRARKILAVDNTTVVRWCVPLICYPAKERKRERKSRVFESNVSKFVRRVS